MSRDEVRVLIAERTAAARDGLAALLAGEDGCRVVGLAADADAVLEMVARFSPSVVLLGCDVPGAVQLTRRIMADTPTPVIVVADAVDVPDTGPLLDEGALSVQLRPRAAAAATRFVAVVMALADVSVVRRRWSVRPGVPHRDPPLCDEDHPPARLVAVAASTGGPVALQQLFGHLPSDLSVPIVVVQHITAGFTPGLVATLQLASTLPIRIPADGDELEPGVVHVAPDDAHLTVTRQGRARLRDEPPVGGFRPSATVLFSSVAASYGPGGLAVVLTGMGTDGLTGLHELHAAGGRILAQDEATSVVFGMPGAAVAAGIAERTAPVGELARYIIRATMPEGSP